VNLSFEVLEYGISGVEAELVRYLGGGCAGLVSC